MRKLISVLILCLSFAFLSFKNKTGQTQVYKLSTGTSLVVWYCQENSQIHSGSFMFSGGSFTMTNNILTAGNFEIDMLSIVDNDERNPTTNKSIIDRLGSSDIFNISVYPKAKFIITEVTRTKDQQYLVEGKLTLKGHTHILRMPLDISISNNKLQAVSDPFLIEGVQYGIKTGVSAGKSETELKNFKFKISQLFAKKV